MIAAAHHANPIQGLLGGLPGPAWEAVLQWLSALGSADAVARRRTVLALRQTHSSLRALVALVAVGGAGVLEVASGDGAAQLAAAETGLLGRALLVSVSLHTVFLEHEWSRGVEAMAEAVRRGHMVLFYGPTGDMKPEPTREAQAALLSASEEGLLKDAYFFRGPASGWQIDFLAQLEAIQIASPDLELMSSILAGKKLRRLFVTHPRWTDVSFLAGLSVVQLHDCIALKDISPLADVPSLAVMSCLEIRKLPPMRNRLLLVSECFWLSDLADLAKGRVECLQLRNLRLVDDHGLSAVASMRPAPPRTVILENMPALRNVSMLAGVQRLVVRACPHVVE